MATITSPTSGANISCSVTVSGTCNGAVTVRMLDSSGNKVNGPPASANCIDGAFSLVYNICGLSAGTDLYVYAEDAGGNDQVRVRLTQTCPAC